MNPVLIETERALPLIQFSVSTLTGAAEDPVGKEGLTRVLARLMRRTPRGMDPMAVDERLDRMGASVGADVGVSASGFSGSVLTRSLDHLSDLLQGMVSEPSLAKSEFDRLKRETLAELLELRDNDRALCRTWFRRAFYPGHTYGRAVGGTATSIRSLNIEDVQEHYRRTFFRDNTQLAFAGDLTAEQANSIQETVLSELPQNGEPTQPMVDPNPPKGRRLVFVDKPERTQAQIIIGTSGTHPSDVDHMALVVANTVFGGTFTSRLTQEVRGKRGWSYGANSYLPYDRKRQAFSMWTFPAAKDAAACIQLQLEMLTSWVNDGITEEELDNAKNYLVHSNAFNIDTAAKRLGLLLDERVYDLPADYYKNYPEAVQAVTLEQANDSIRARISPKDLVVAVVGTHAQIGAEVEAAIADLSHQQKVRYDEE